MKNGDYIKLTKLSPTQNPLVSTSEMKDYKPGQDNGDNVSLPTDYWIEGFLLTDIVIGKGIIVDRRIRKRWKGGRNSNNFNS